jgi:hypothetical protein
MAVSALVSALVSGGRARGVEARVRTPIAVASQPVEPSAEPAGPDDLFPRVMTGEGR